MKAARQRKNATKVFNFTLVYEGIEELTREVADAIFEAGCDDALLGMRAGEMTLDFARDSNTYREALISAIDAVERCNLPVQLVRVEPLSSVEPE